MYQNQFSSPATDCFICWNELILYHNVLFCHLCCTYFFSIFGVLDGLCFKIALFLC